MANKHGYDGKRTLERYVQAHKGFKKDLSLEDISSKTGWSKPFVDKLKEWWESEFTSIAPIQRETECLASPENVDVALLRSWGIPSKKTAAILLKWRTFHREGKHDMCQVFSILEVDLKQNNIPFKQANILLEAELEARELGIINASRDIRISRKYRSWESIEQYNAFIKEVQNLDEALFETKEYTRRS